MFNGQIAILLLTLVLSLASFPHILAANNQIKQAAVRAYVTRHHDHFTVASNVYAIAQDETLLLEDHSIAQRMKLSGDELMINFPEHNQQISLGRLQGLEQLENGERKFLIAQERVQFRLVKEETRRKLVLVSCRADIFCGPTFKIDKKIVQLHEIRTHQGLIFCLNRGLQRDREAIYPGNCQRY